MTGRPAIELDHVTYAFDGHPVLRDIDLTIAEGDFATVVGPNGGGKTTLLRIILGLLAPTSGTVRVFGLPPAEARPRIGYLPQHSFADPSFPARVLDVVMTGRLSGRVRPAGASAEDLAAADEVLGEVALEDDALRPFSALSGGQRQRALIARALVTRPDLLLLDEPTASLDAVMEDELHDLLGRLRERLTIVLVTHDLGFVSGFTKTVVCLKGTVVCHPTGELTADLIRDVYGRDVRAVLHGHTSHGGEARG
jgi:zinc transport system ATP-binding protein